MTQKEYIGAGNTSVLKDILVELNSKRIFLVTGKKSYSLSGAEDYLKNLLEEYEVNRFFDFSVNVKIEDVAHGIEIFSADNYDTVVAVGGGSVIDMAKAINYLASHSLSLGGFKVEAALPASIIIPVIAVPTTSGSGSESTSFAVVYVAKQKYSIADDSILPKVAIVDANLTLSCPKYVTAVSGLDALSQAVESYWSINSTDVSKALARDAIRLAVTNLAEAVNKPTYHSRLNMARAAHLAGKAINITKTTAAHSVSYPLTAYFGIPHGQAVGVLLSSLLVFNADVSDKDALDKRGAGYVKKTVNEICNFLGASDPNDAKGKLDSLIQAVGLQTSLSGLELRKEQEIETIINRGFDPDRVNNNPRQLTAGALRKILHEIS